MKKIIFILICTILPFAMAAKSKVKVKPINTFKNCYIYGQSGRNSSKKGSAMCLSSGATYSMANAVDKVGTKDIDIMLYFGKVKKDKIKVFHLFSPNDPTLNVDWEKSGGTAPYCKFEGPSRDPNAYYALKNWKSRNTTKLERASNINFDNASAELIESLSVSDSYITSDIKIGDVILFQLGEKSAHPNRKGLIKIIAVEDDEEKPERSGNGQYQRLIVNIKVQR